MKKLAYEQPNMQVLVFSAEDVVRTSGNSVAGSGDAIFEGYSSEAWN